MAVLEADASTVRANAMARRGFPAGRSRESGDPVLAALSIELMSCLKLRPVVTGSPLWRGRPKDRSNAHQPRQRPRHLLSDLGRRPSARPHPRAAVRSPPLALPGGAVLLALPHHRDGPARLRPLRQAALAVHARR